MSRLGPKRFATDERLAGLIGFAWGVAEGLFFFIVPDVYISFAALFSILAGAAAWLGSIAGSLVAVATIQLIAGVLHLDYLGFLALLPGISSGLIDRVHARLAAGGLPYSPFLALGGVPLKVYAAVALSGGMTLGSVLLWTVFARIVRIAPTYAAAAAARLIFRRRIDTRPRAWSVLLGCFWVAFYVFYFVRMRRV